MEKPDNVLFELQKVINNLALVERNHHKIKHESAENDVEHSYSVAMISWYIYDKIKPDINLGKILKYALIHDFVEVYAGDINSFASAEKRAKKVEDEKLALIRLSKEFKEFPDLVKMLKNYETKKGEESLFVWTIDKMQPLILGDLDNWRPYKKLSIEYESYMKKHKEQLGICSKYCYEIFENLVEYCKVTHYPENK